MTPRKAVERVQVELFCSQSHERVQDGVNDFLFNLRPQAVRDVKLTQNPYGWSALVVYTADVDL